MPLSVQGIAALSGSPSVALLDEPVTWAAIVGLGLILAGVALASSPRRTAAAAEA